MKLQQSLSIQTFNYQSLMLVPCCGRLYSSAFVMRRSSVRLRLWAIPPHPYQRKLLRVFLCSKNSSFVCPWHTHGTLNRNRSQLLKHFTSFLFSGLTISVGRCNSCESLFQCAISVPRITIVLFKPRWISDLRPHNIALYMRCCGYIRTFGKLLRNLKEG